MCIAIVFVHGPLVSFLAQCDEAVPNVNCDQTTMDESIKNWRISPAVWPELKLTAQTHATCQRLGPWY